MPSLSQLFETKSVESLRESADAPEHALKKNLSAFDLLMFGIGAIIGAGIFSAIGSAAGGNPVDMRPGAGPALVISFIVTAVACGFTGLCYAEMASMIPISGSAYTYAYATLGELMAWIIGWDLLLEYAVSNVAVAISWGGYFRTLLENVGIHMPPWMCIDPRKALELSKAYLEGHGLTPDTVTLTQKLGVWAQVQQGTLSGADAFAHWDALGTAPIVAGYPITLNVLAIAITVAITWLCYVGIKESAKANSIMVVVKLFILLAVVVVGARYIDPANYQPFSPNGWQGIQAGAGIIFFAFIGFDAVSTTAEECNDPGRDLPRGILGSLLICTVVYILVSVVVTGMINWKQLSGIEDPLAYVFQQKQMFLFSTIVSVGAVIATAAALLVYQIGQPRIFLAMSRDGLLGPWFGRISPRHGTPSNATILTGFLVALPAGLMNIDEVVDLANIGTLFAFVIVCVGVLILRMKRPDIERRFSVPSVWVCAPLGILSCIWLARGLPNATWVRFFVWLVVGLVIYFGYSMPRSVLHRRLHDGEAS
ncbi:MAG: amino acid permease [Proteobacteria bacterium]|nr:amino acid permease [Pseudomonadota bacterium]